MRIAAGGLVLALLLAAAPAAAEDAKPEPEKVPLSEFFAGKVVSVKKNREVELLYDFDDPGQLIDFEATIPFRAIQTVKFVADKGRIRLKGTGSMRHKAVFKEKVWVEVDFTTVRNHDFGFAITEERESEVYTLYCIYDLYFSAGDGVLTNQNMIIKFIPRDPKANADGFQDWRYCGSRGPKPKIVRGATYKVSASRGENKSGMWISGETIKEWHSRPQKEAGRDLTSQMVAIYGYDTDVRFDNLRIRGNLDPGYVKRHRLDVTPMETEDDDPAVEEDLGPQLPEDEMARVRVRINRYPVKTKPVTLAKMLRNPELPYELRDEAAARAESVGSKRIVPYLLDGLAAEDALSRTYSLRVFKSLVGKTFGYRVDGPLSSRSGSMKRINAYIMKRQKDFE